MTTIVIPAHNEADVIEACLDSVLGDAEPGEFEVIVAANGCTDDTIAIAERWAQHLGHSEDLTVIAVDEASKVAALNASLKAASGPTIVFVDADVTLSTAAVRSLRSALDTDCAHAAATSLHVDDSAASPISRSYHRYWQRVPSIANGLAGRGVYALNGAAIDRLGSFPSVLADDRHIDLLFDQSERTVVSETSTVAASRTVRELIERKVRVFAGNRELAATHQTGGSISPSFAGALRTSPQQLVDLPAYLLVNAIAKVRARHTGRRGVVSWGRDESTRARRNEPSMLVLEGQSKKAEEADAPSVVQAETHQQRSVIKRRNHV